MVRSETSKGRCPSRTIVASGICSAVFVILGMITLVIITWILNNDLETSFRIFLL